MYMDVGDLVDNLYTILTSRIAQQRFYKARAGGFKNELEFEKLIKDIPTLDAGQMLFTKKPIDGELGNNIVYVTVSPDDPEKYTEFYDILKRFPSIKKMFFLRTDSLDKWTSTQISVSDGRKRSTMNISRPLFTQLEYIDGNWKHREMDQIKDMFASTSPRTCKKKDQTVFEYLKKYDVNQISKIYANRFFLDVTLIGRSKGMIDFDHIIKINEKYSVVETKEKTPMQNPRSFGWDSRRACWYLYLKHVTGLDCTYVIREIDDISKREFVKWRAIKMDDFFNNASWLSERQGGGGGGTISAPYESFEDPAVVLNNRMVL